MSRILTLCLAGAGLLLSTAPAADWPSFRGNPAMHGVASGSITDTLELKWQVDTKDAVRSSPVVADDRVVFASLDGSIRSADRSTGTIHWTHQAGAELEAPPLLLADRVIIGTSDGDLLALSIDDGNLLWKVATEDRILGAANIITPTNAPPLVVFGSYDFFLYGVDAKDGTVKWKLGNRKLHQRRARHRQPIYILRRVRWFPARGRCCQRK